MELILVVLIILALGGGFWGHRNYNIGLDSPIGVILIFLIVVLALGLLVPHTGWYRY